MLSALAQIVLTTSCAVAVEPTYADVPYGPDPRQVLDVYLAPSKKETVDRPTPVLFFVHGGGWLNGDKRTFNDQAPYLAAGITVVSIEYRFVSQAIKEGVKPPVKVPLHDAARALQFVRSKATGWNLDKTRIAASGSSAGACTCLWLAFHDDLADPNSPDPVARESTRLFCAAVTRAQTTLDPKQMTEWIPNNRYGAHAFGFESKTGLRRDAYDEFLAKRDEILPWIKEYSPYELATKDDPPIYLFYDTDPAMGQERENPGHSANFGQGLSEKLRRIGVDCEFVYPSATDVKHPRVQDYLISKLKPRP
jgi:acetyl esterase/lipase